jgi:hypothetical protein
VASFSFGRSARKLAWPLGRKKGMKNYSNEIAKYWTTIMQAWEEHAHHHPIIECDLMARKVFAYPATDYLNSLSERSRAKALLEYKTITAAGGMVLFIKDPKKRIIQSYSFDADEIAPQE